MGEGHDHTTPYTPYDFPAGNARYIASPSYTPNMVVGARSRTGIVTCCDARCSPEHYFDMDINEAFVIRNGGGRTAEESVIRTLALIQVLSEVKEVMVVHHTDCGALAYTDPWVREVIATNDASAPGGPWKKGALAWAEGIAYQPFIPSPVKENGEVKPMTERERVERSVRLDVEYLRMHPLVKETVKVSGWVFDLGSGKVEALDC